MPQEKLLARDIVVNLTVIVVTLGSIYLALKVAGPHEMRAWIEAAGVAAPLALVVAKTTTIVFAPLSGAFLYPLAGTLFGFGKGLLLVVIGDALGGTIAFFLSRQYGRSLVEKMLGNESGLLKKVLETIGTVRGFFVTRLLLLTAQDILAYAAGLTQLPYLPFIVIHASIGLIPATIMTALGNSLLQDPSMGGLGLVFLFSGIVGAISVAGFMWYTSHNGVGEASPKESV